MGYQIDKMIILDFTDFLGCRVLRKSVRIDFQFLCVWKQIRGDSLFQERFVIVSLLLIKYVFCV